jgi:membrane protease YdiL (CAAX protease family)
MTRHMRTRVALTTTLAMLLAYHELRRVVIPEHLHFAANTAMIGVVALPAMAASMTAAELGLRRADLMKGLRYGSVAVVAVGVATGAAMLLGATDAAFVEQRTSFDLGEMLLQVFVEIPVATVLLEEFAFRGVVAGLFERVLGARAALASSALVFGLWHVSPSDFTSASGLAGALGTIAVTAVAGAGFHLLKRRSGSLLAPAMAHWATNGVTLAVSWLAVRAAG